jgi:hypothetical protein
MAGTTAFIVYGSSVHLVDISDPANPRPVSSVSPAGSVQNILLHDKFLHVAAFGSWQTYDISNPAAPISIYTNDTPVQALDIEITNPVAYVADGYSRKVLRYDITDPRQPVELPALNLPAPANSVSIRGEHLYVAHGTDGLRIYSFTQTFPLRIHLLADPFRIQVLSDAPLSAADFDRIQLQSSSDLNSWSTIPAPREASAAVLTFTPNLPPTATQLFFRAVLRPQTQ